MARAGIYEHTLLIVNPTSQSGRGEGLARQAEKICRNKLPANSLDVFSTTRRAQASEIAASTANYSLVISCGGDGLAHEVVNGLMALEADSRPTLAVIPTGSGNDYARALGIPFDLKAASETIFSGRPKRVDIGCVNGQYYAETLSFGLDAAIALETMERRLKSGQSGLPLYFKCGINQLVNHFNMQSYTAIFDDEEPVSASSLTFAVQIGPYYGSGFKICPDADMSDGLFDICISHGPVSQARAIAVFIRAKNGNHTKSKMVSIRRARKMHIEFEDEPPTQFDGEEIKAKTFDISMEAGALEVIVPA